MKARANAAISASRNVSGRRIGSMPANVSAPAAFTPHSTANGFKAFDSVFLRWLNMVRTMRTNSEWSLTSTFGGRKVRRTTAECTLG